jgi:hypothetical protein
MLEPILQVVIIALLVAIAGGVQKGINQIIKGLESIDQRLASPGTRGDGAHGSGPV